MRVVAAVSFPAVAVKVGELVAARPGDPAAVTCSAVAAAAAACAAASAHAAVTVVTPTYVTPLKRPKQTSLASFFQSPSPLTPPPAVVGHNEVSLCLLWFKGQHDLVGKQRQMAWNENQKVATKLLATVPMRHLQSLHAVFVSQSTAKPQLKPKVPEEFSHYVSFGAAVAPGIEIPLFVTCVPTLAEACAEWLVGTTTAFKDIVRAVLHFVQCTVNDARACAKEIERVVPRHRIKVLLATSAHSAVPPRGFPMLADFQAHARHMPVVPGASHAPGYVRCTLVC